MILIRNVPQNFNQLLCSIVIYKKITSVILAIFVNIKVKTNTKLKGFILIAIICLLFIDINIHCSIKSFQKYVYNVFY